MLRCYGVARVSGLFDLAAISENCALGTRFAYVQIGALIDFSKSD